MQQQQQQQQQPTNSFCIYIYLLSLLVSKIQSVSNVRTMWVMYRLYRVFLLSFPWARQLSRHVWAEGGFLCDKAVVLGETKKHTPCIYIYNCLYVIQPTSYGLRTLRADGIGGLNTGKGKGHPRTGHESSTLSLTSAQHWVCGQRHAPAALYPGKTRYLLYGKLGGPQGRSGWVRTISPPPEFDLRTVQHVGSRYADWAILTHNTTCSFMKNGTYRVFHDFRA